MLTVYKYGFEMPPPPEPPTTSPLTYILVAAAAWWAWRSGWARKLIGGTAA